VKVKEKEMRQ